MSWGVFGGILGASWAVLGASWKGLGGLLGGSWGVLGALGSPWVVLDPTGWAAHSTWGKNEVPFGIHLGPCWRPSRAKFGPSRLLTSFFCRKSRFSRSTTFSHGFGSFLTPRGAPRRHQVGPRWLQEGLLEPFFGFRILDEKKGGVQMRTEESRA